MTCELGFQNAEMEGGTYSGKDIGNRFIGIYSKLSNDGYLNPDKGPLVYFNFPQEVADGFSSDPSMYLHELLGDKSKIESLACLGPRDDPHSCRKCPYLSK